MKIGTHMAPSRDTPPTVGHYAEKLFTVQTAYSRGFAWVGGEGWI